MKADEFLALVEKHPLPWDLNDADDIDLTHYTDAAHVRVAIDWSAVHEIADAAPALAAAAIRLLRARERAHEDADAACDATELFDALRAALPEEMR